MAKNEDSGIARRVSTIGLANDGKKRLPSLLKTVHSITK